jgi:hypothetical protein
MINEEEIDNDEWLSEDTIGGYTDPALPPPPLPIVRAPYESEPLPEVFNVWGKDLPYIEHIKTCPTSPASLGSEDESSYLIGVFNSLEFHKTLIERPIEKQLVFDEDNLKPSLTYSSDNLAFSSQFESGNLRRVYKVKGVEGETEIEGAAIQYHDILSQVPEVDEEYELYLRNDVYTNGNIQWYYFAVTGGKANQRVRFTIRLV